MSLGLFNCRLIQPARDQLFFFAGCLAAPVPVRASSVQSPCDASCSAPTSGRARNASCVFPSQEGFVLVFRGSEAPVGCRRVHPTDSPTNSPEDPPILPIDSAIEPKVEEPREYSQGKRPVPGLPPVYPHLILRHEAAALQSRKSLSSGWSVFLAKLR